MREQRRVPLTTGNRGRRRRSWRVYAGGLVAAAAVFCGAFASATLATPGSATSRTVRSTALLFRADLIRITSPRAGVVPSRAGGLTVALKADRSVRSVSAHLNGRSVPGAAVRRRGSGHWTIRLRARDGLRLGPNYLTVDAASKQAKGFASVGFRYASPARGLAQILAPVGGARAPGGPVAVTLLGAHGAQVAAWLNGRSLASDLGRVRGGRGPGRAVFPLLVGASDGLRYGRDVLVMRSYRAGRYQTVRRTFTVTRARPLPGAGRNRSGLTGITLRFNGTQSRPMRRGMKLAYRWRILRAPRGSRAKLRGATTARPSLKPDARGTYKLGLVVSARGRARTASAAAASSGEDPVTVVAAPSYPLQQIKTMVPQPGKSDPNCVDFSLGPATGGTPVGMDCAPIQLLVLDRATLEVNAKKTFQSVGALNADFINEGYNNQELLALQIHPASASGPDWDPVILNQALSRIGCKPQYPGVGGHYAIQAFVVPRNDDQPPSFAECKQTGNAYDVGLALDPYLIENAKNLFSFVLGDYARFKTAYGDPASQSEGTMSIAGTTYSDTPAAHGWSGWSAGQPYFHLVVVSADQPAQGVETGAYPVTQDALQALAKTLQHYANPVDEVYLQTVGKPTMPGPADPAITSWYAVGAAIDTIGGTANTFNTAISGSSYALAGGVAIKDEGRLERSEVTPHYPDGFTGKPQPAFLAGTLSRNDSGWFTPETLVNPSQENDQLFSIAFQPPTPWFEDDPSKPAAQRKQYADALAWIGGQLNIADIHAAYYTATDSVAWSVKRQDLQILAYPGPASGFDENMFNQVKSDLLHEFEWVVTVQTLFTDLAEPFQKSDNHTFVNLTNISDDIAAKQLHVLDQDVNTTPALLSMISGLLDAGLEEVPGASLIGAGLELAGEIATLADEDNAPLDKEVTIKSDQLAQNLLDESTARVSNLTRLRNVILADPGKLEAFGDHDPTKEPAWNPGNTDAINDAVSRIEASANQIAYATLMPVVADLYELEPGYYWAHNNSDLPDATKWECIGKYDTHHHPFEQAPPSSQVKLRLGTTPYTDMNALRANPPWRMFVGMPKPVHDPFGGGDYYRTPYHGLEATVTDPLFKPVSAGGIGLFGPWFWSPDTVFRGDLIKAFDVPGENSVIYNRCHMWW